MNFSGNALQPFRRRFPSIDSSPSAREGNLRSSSRGLYGLVSRLSGRSSRRSTGCLVITCVTSRHTTRTKERTTNGDSRDSTRLPPSTTSQQVIPPLPAPVFPNMHLSPREFSGLEGPRGSRRTVGDRLRQSRSRHSSSVWHSLRPRPSLKPSLRPSPRPRLRPSPYRDAIQCKQFIRAASPVDATICLHGTQTNVSGPILWSRHSRRPLDAKVKGSSAGTIVSLLFLRLVRRRRVRAKTKKDRESSGVASPLPISGNEAAVPEVRSFGSRDSKAESWRKNPTETFFPSISLRRRRAREAIVSNEGSRRYEGKTCVREKDFAFVPISTVRGRRESVSVECFSQF